MLTGSRLVRFAVGNLAPFAGHDIIRIGQPLGDTLADLFIGQTGVFLAPPGLDGVFHLHAVELFLFFHPRRSPVANEFRSAYSPVVD